MEAIRELLRRWLDQGLAPVARALSRLGVPPTAITLTGVAINLVTAGLVAAGDLAAAGIVYLVAGAFDLLDGHVARLSGTASPAGAFLDSTLDRVSEGLVFAAVAYHLAATDGPLAASLVVLALLGSFLISYTRARGEALGAECRIGLVSRAERVVLLAAGLLVDWLAETIVLLVALTAYTVAQRIVHILRQLRGAA